MKAVEGDINELLQLSTDVTNVNSRAFLGDERVNRFMNSPFFRSEIVDQIDNMTILKDQTRIIALAVFDKNELVSLMLHPDYQGKGVGSYFLESLLEDFFTQYDVVTLECFKDNIKANKFYTRMGFELRKTYTDEYLKLERNEYVKKKTN